MLKSLSADMDWGEEVTNPQVIWVTQNSFHLKVTVPAASRWGKKLTKFSGSAAGSKAMLYSALVWAMLDHSQGPSPTPNLVGAPAVTTL